MSKGRFRGDFRDTKTKPTGIILAPPTINWDLSGIQPSPPQPHVNWGKPAPIGGTFGTTVNNYNGGFNYTPPPTKPKPTSATATKVVLKQSTFEYSFDTTGVMAYAGKMDATSVRSLADLINIRGTMKNGWGPNVFAKITVLDLSHCGLTGVALNPLFQSMYHQKMNLNVLNLSHNLLCDQSSPALLDAIHNKSSKQVHSIKSIMLNNNQFGDKTAEYFSWHLSSGTLNYTKSINLAGNNITPKVGYKFFVEALTSPKVQNIAVTLETQKDQSAVVEFLKKGASYYSGIWKDQFKSNIDAMQERFIRTNEDSVAKICALGVSESTVGVTLGLAKCTNPVAKAMNMISSPSGAKASFISKLVGKLNIFACVAQEEGDHIVNVDLLDCVTTYNTQLLGSSITSDTDTDSCLIM